MGSLARPSKLLNPLALSAVLSLCCMVPLASAAASETRAYVVSTFTNAAYSTSGDCQGGIDPDETEQYKLDLLALGMSPAKVQELMKKYPGGPVINAVVNRGRIDGKPVSAYANPAAVIDPKLHWVTGRYAYGFNLDGKGADSPNSFEDPDTHELGVNNQLFRLFGCHNDFRGPPGNATPGYWYTFIFNEVRDNFPAWVITISGEDLSKDGPVTISIDRSLDRVLEDANQTAESGSTFRVDPAPGSVNVFQGQLQHGVVTITDNHDLHLLGDPNVVLNLDLTHTHLRLTMEPNGGLKGFIGGYQRWWDIFFPFGHAGINFEEQGADIPGIYYGLKNLADADPDPKTGQNQRISATWQLEAVPAFVVPAQDQNLGSVPSKPQVLSEATVRSEAADPVQAPAVLSVRR